jgi:tetratricopeptide (TPR) repeat protein
VPGARFAILIVWLGSLCTGAIARAESPEAEVERLAADAVNAYKGADYKRAVELLQKAYDIRQVPALLYNMAKAYDKLGDVEHAYDAYHKYADSEAADPKLKARAEQRVAALNELRKKKKAEERAVETPPPPPPVETKPVVPPEQVPPPLSEEERRARAHDEFMRDRHRARVITIAAGGATVVVAAVALGLSVNALSLQHQFDRATLPADKSRFESDAKVQAGVADGLWCVTAVGAGVTGYFLYRSFRHEPPPPLMGFAPVVTPTGGGLAVAGRF